MNLLLSHQRKSRQAGDDGEMIQARRRFFDSGVFEPVLQTVDTLIPARAGRLCDAGCGEGTLLGRLSQWRPGDYYGLDVSKPAVKTAAKRYKQCQWLVANIMRDIPLADQSMDAVLSVLAPRNPREFARILKPGGSLILGVPGPRHLLEVREKLMPRLDDFGTKADEGVSQCGDFFQEKSRRVVEYSRRLAQTELSDLARMTPLFWNTTAQARQALYDLPALDVHINFVFLVLEKTGTHDDPA
ncbi:MAG: methyltransferase domain-containing protein [Lentisphaeria bacterium]|nr:methyltransferase domain-containing protein [Lentisphaeria bacterium]